MRAALVVLFLSSPAFANGPAFNFASIDGGTLSTESWRGKPVLVVNTASLCGFAGQFANLQALSDRYQGRAVVLAVPSDDFAQELGSEAEVKEYCDANFDLTIPMTTIQHVAKGDLHPFYSWLRNTQGFTPGWNFNKVLLDPEGEFVQGWGAAVKPDGRPITAAIDALLAP